MTMLEAEWLTSTDPAAMLAWLEGSPTSRKWEGSRMPSDRRLRLFACAACRQVWHLLTDEVECHNCHGDGKASHPAFKGVCPNCKGAGHINRSRRAVEVAERFADGLATEEERREAFELALLGRASLTTGEPYNDPWAAGDMAVSAITVDDPRFPFDTPLARKNAKAFAALLRDVVGNPFRPVTLPSTPCPNCRGTPCVCQRHWEREPASITCPWLTPTVLSVARAAYDLREWDRLPVLADALEDAGVEPDSPCPECAETGVVRPYCSTCPGTGRVPNPVLAHLRGPGPHVRGCFVLDALLGLG